MTSASTGETSTASVTQIFEFASHFIENILVRPNGHLLLTSIGSGDVFTVDPAALSPSAKSVVSCPGSTGLSGIAAIGDNFYAVTGGIHSSFRFDDMHVYVVSLPEDNDLGTILDIISVPNAIGLNGMASLPKMPRVVLSVDSHGSCIYRINTLTRKVDIAISDPLLGHGPTFKVGVNGIKISNDYVYFTNSGQGHYSRVKINDDGSKAGDVEIIARLQGEPAGMGHAYDDFTLDSEDNAYVGTHLNAVMKITKDGIQTTFAGGDENSVFKGPTSAATSLDGKFIYVATAGMSPGKAPGERVFNGQVFKLPI